MNEMFTKTNEYELISAAQENSLCSFQELAKLLNEITDLYKKSSDDYAELNRTLAMISDLKSQANTIWANIQNIVNKYNNES